MTAKQISKRIAAVKTADAINAILAIISCVIMVELFG